MPRVVFHRLANTPPGLETVLRKPARAPAGYSPTIFVVEWLTLNCRSDWGSAPGKDAVVVRFTDPADRDRGRALAWAASQGLLG